MRQLISASVICVLAVTASVASGARTLKVPQKYPTIQAAVNAAAPGDKVAVDDGSYSELVDVATPNIELVGQDGTILDGTAFGGSGAVVTSGIRVESEGVTVRGFTIQNYGTGIVATAGSALIADNTVLFCGSGIVCAIHGDITVAPKSTVDHNVVSGDFDGIVLSDCDNVTVTHNAVALNSDTGISVQDSTTGCTVTHNTSDSNGADGIFIDFTCSEITVDHNIALLNGVFDAEDQLAEFGFPSDNDWDHNIFGTTAGV